MKKVHLECPCTDLTGEARVDCPDCGGEGVVVLTGDAAERWLEKARRATEGIQTEPWTAEQRERALAWALHGLDLPRWIVTVEGGRLTPLEVEELARHLREHGPPPECFRINGLKVTVKPVRFPATKTADQLWIG